MLRSPRKDRQVFFCWLNYFYFLLISTKVEILFLNYTHGSMCLRSGYDHIFEDEELEEVPMASSKKTEFLEKEVLPDDTLQSIALEFNVAVRIMQNFMHNLFLFS